MSCLKATASRIGVGIRAASELVGDRIDASVESVGEHLSAFASSVSDGVVAGSILSGDRLQARASLMCSVGGEPVYYVRVSPDEVQWITDDMGVFFDVESNTEWIVEKS